MDAIDILKKFWLACRNSLKLLIKIISRNTSLSIPTSSSNLEKPCLRNYTSQNKSVKLKQ